MAAITSNGTGGGNWSAGASWTGAVVPVEGDTVIVQNGDTITIDQNITVGADSATAAIDVASGGKFELLSTAAADYTLICKGDLYVSSGGTIEIGTVANPIPPTRKFEIKLNYSASLSEGKYGLENYGEMIIQGANKTVKTLLISDLSVTGTVWTVGDTTDWEVGDRLAVASTTRTYSEAEDKVIQTVDSGTQVTMTAGATNAHSGISPTQAEVINLTRNVKVTSYNTSYRGYVHCPAGSKQNVDYVEFYMIGYNSSTKRGIEIKTTVADDTNFAYCSVWGKATSNYPFYLYYANNVVIDNCVIYNTDEEFYSRGNNNIITNNIAMKITDIGFYITSSANTTLENNVVTSCSSSGFYIYGYTSTFSSFDDNISHSNNTYGFYFYATKSQDICNLTSWRNGNYGTYMSATINLYFDTPIIFGNNQASIYINASGVLTFKDLRSSGDTSFSTSNGIYFSGNQYGELIFEDSKFSEVSGIKIAHTRDFNMSTGFCQIVMRNSELGSVTPVYYMGQSVIGSYVQCEDLGQVKYADKGWYRNGIVIRDGAVKKYNDYSTRFDFQQNNGEWLDYEVQIPVKNGEQIVVSAWLRKNASYTDANRPKITLSKQGITEDSDQMSDVTDTWERVTVQGTPTRNGLATLTISVYLVNSGAKAWADFAKTDILTGVLNTIEGEFWANGHIAQVFMDTGSITSAEFWKTLTADINESGSFGNLFKDYVDAAISNCVRSTTPANTLNVSATGEADVDLIKISGDSTAADNLEATYDGTGYTNDSAPSTQEQIGRLTSGTAAINTTAESFTKSGAEPETNTYTSTFALDGTFHIVEDIIATGITNAYYQFDVGGNGVPVSITWQGYAQGNTDTYKLYAYNYVTPGYEQIGSIAAANGTTIIDETYSLTNAHVGTGVNLGKVRFRFYSTDGSAFATDRILCSYAIVTKSVGYEDGAIWVDTNASNTNTENYVDGTADNPVSTWTAAKTLSTSMGLKKFHIVNGSSITLNSNSDNFTFVGHEWTLTLGGQSIANAHFQHAVISGTSTGLGAHFDNCEFGTCSLTQCNCSNCRFPGNTTTLLSTEIYVMTKCGTGGGLSPPIFDFVAALGSSHIVFSDWSGGAELANLGVSGTDKVSIIGNGKLTIGSTCAGGTIGIHGNVTITDNVIGGFSGTINDDARYDVDQINKECDTALTDYDPPTRTEATDDKDEILVDTTLIKTKTDYIPSDLAGVPTATELNTSHGSGSWEGTTPVDVADAVWDEPMSGHTIAGTFGKHVNKKLLTFAKWLGLK